MVTYLCSYVSRKPTMMEFAFLCCNVILARTLLMLWVVTSKPECRINLVSFNILAVLCQLSFETGLHFSAEGLFGLSSLFTNFGIIWWVIFF